MNAEDLTPWLNDFADRSFRNVADQEYVAARQAYRARLIQPFLWNAHQAIEKYLKAILLYNGRSAKGIRHDLREGLRRVISIEDIQFAIPDDVAKFIEYLDDYGPNRYLEYTSVLRQHALLEFDRTVWYVRRYCWYLRGESRSSEGDTIHWLPLSLRRIRNPSYEERPHSFRISGGLLELILEKNTEAACFLVWSNFYFGRRHRKRIRNYRWHIASTNPTHVMHPELFSHLAQYVDFSRPVRVAFQGDG